MRAGEELPRQTAYPTDTIVIARSVPELSFPVASLLVCVLGGAGEDRVDEGGGEFGDEVQFSPGNVAGMCVTNQDLPLIARQPLNVQVPAAEVTNRRAAIAKRAGVAWVVENAQHVIVREGSPDQLTFCRTGPNPARKQQLRVSEMPDGSARGSRAAIGLKH